jgi:hypothetical protein
MENRKLRARDFVPIYGAISYYRRTDSIPSDKTEGDIDPRLNGLILYNFFLTAGFLCGTVAGLAKLLN